jgi:NAD(P)-dependent dehydrogenase (short-subunit alcohol dehydrogenase family)
VIAFAKEGARPVVSGRRPSPEARSLTGRIADSVVFVASDKAAYFTGRIIRVNGGETAS